jgi:hypothetical protein
MKNQIFRVIYYMKKYRSHTSWNLLKSQKKHTSQLEGFITSANIRSGNQLSVTRATYFGCRPIKKQVTCVGQRQYKMRSAKEGS